MTYFNDTAGASLFAATLISGLQNAGMVLVTAPPIIHAMDVIRSGGTPEVRASFRESYRQIWPLLAGLVLFVIGSGFWFLFLFTVPVAIWFAVRWQFFGQAVILDEVPSGAAALRRSGQAVSGNWWQVLWRTIAFQLLIVLPGPLVGIVLLLGGKTSVQFANVVSSFVYAVTVPIAVIGFTQAYQTFRARRRDEAAAPAIP